MQLNSKSLETTRVPMSDGKSDPTKSSNQNMTSGEKDLKSTNQSEANMNSTNQFPEIRVTESSIEGYEKQANITQESKQNDTVMSSHILSQSYSNESLPSEPPDNIDDDVKPENISKINVFNETTPSPNKDVNMDVDKAQKDQQNVGLDMKFNDDDLLDTPLTNLDTMVNDQVVMAGEEEEQNIIDEEKLLKQESTKAR